MPGGGRGASESRRRPPPWRSSTSTTRSIPAIRGEGGRPGAMMKESLMRGGFCEFILAHDVYRIASANLWLHVEGCVIVRYSVVY